MNSGNEGGTNGLKKLFPEVHQKPIQNIAAGQDRWVILRGDRPPKLVSSGIFNDRPFFRHEKH